MVNVNRDFEDALIDPSFAISPMKPMRFFLDLGTLIGVFPAKRGDKHIFFGLMNQFLNNYLPRNSSKDFLESKSALTDLNISLQVLNAAPCRPSGQSSSRRSG